MTTNNDYMSGIINGCRIILAVKFMFANSNESLFICTVDLLATVLKKQGYNNKKEIEFIKEFNPQTLTFKRIAKAQLLKWSEMDPEAYLYLKNHYYFN